MTAKPKPGFGFFRTERVVLMVILSLLRPAWGAVDNPAPPAPATEAKSTENDTMGPQDFLRSYLELQEQLRDTQSAIQKVQQELATYSASNSAAVEDRLQSMEKTIADAHTEQVNGMAHLDRTILIAAGTFACIGFLVLLLAAYLQWSAAHRMTAASRPALAADLRGPLPQPVQALERSNLRLVELIDRLEQRIHDLEASTTPASVLLGTHFTGEENPEKASPPAVLEKSTTVNLLISKSQSLMKLDKPEVALECLDEALALDPTNADALVKKGAALEQLQRVPEAIQCYDRAIAQDASMTMAYLRRGSLFTRFDRHSEALACYEQALKSGKTATATAEPEPLAPPNRLVQPL